MDTLQLAGTYRRRVGASLARIWENVLDWEHLPALHESSFAAVELIETAVDGWTIALIPQPGTPESAQRVHLSIDRTANRYAVKTETGPGTSSEIRVQLTPEAPHQTSVVVEYHVPVSDPVRRAQIGAGFVTAYERLWDEDEAMMRAREAALAATANVPEPAQLVLGSCEVVGPGHIFAFGRQRFRLVELGGALLAHSITCPHWLGPLEVAPVENGCVRCPWHGYRFDIATGRSVDGRRLRLTPPPKIEVENGTVVARRG